jgi:hypothetical protein
LLVFFFFDVLFQRFEIFLVLLVRVGFELGAREIRFNKREDFEA